jgi:hypothetical protein
MIFFFIATVWGLQIIDGPVTIKGSTNIIVTSAKGAN